MQFIISSEDELVNVARAIVNEMQYCLLVLVHGELGAGKTTLIGKMIKEMGCLDPISSPTFSIVTEYLTDNGVVYHMDWYRINQSAELDEIGIDEYLYSGRPCFIEWPERDIQRLSDMPAIKVTIEQIADKRKIEIITAI
ncbi:MAG: tRNA (adenosine(37)-N6)-threonylcarbamoyltransferase complex ATPase subunit type 1 TsaE [Flavobacteriales bacterium]|nr:tRNA (adenosine(37)-N6)-threonylcarbamoyltransferase complex ATPase subunit type 1 TsaE [Flavobacteriales bacterium]